MRKTSRNKNVFAFTKLSLFYFLLLASLGSRFGHLRVLGFLGDLFDDTDGDGLSHVTDSETSERRVFRESLDTHGLGGNQFGNAGITGFDRLGFLFQFFSGSS